MILRCIRNQEKNFTHWRLYSSLHNATCCSIDHRSLFSSAFLENDTDAPRRSWQAQHNIDIQRVTEKAIMHELTKQQTETMERMVPWFLKQMPSAYFLTVPETYRMDHLKAISAIEDANLDPYMNLKSHLPDGRFMLTYIRPGTGRILNVIQNLPRTFSGGYLPLTKAQVFTSEDEKLSISIFVYGNEVESNSKLHSGDGAHILDYAKKIQDGQFSTDRLVPSSCDLFNHDELRAYFQKCPKTYILRSEPRRFLKQRLLYEEVSGTECMAVSFEQSEHEHSMLGDYWIDIAVTNSLPQTALENAARVLAMNNLDIMRSHLDVLSDGNNGNVTMLRLLVSSIDKDKPLHDEILDPVKEELKRTKWMDPITMDLVFTKYPWLGVIKGEIITAMCCLLHPIMAPTNQYAFSRSNIFETIMKDRYIRYASDIADLFLDRFNPNDPIRDDEFSIRKEKLSKHFGSDVEDSLAKELLAKMLDIVSHTLRTNVYLQNRYALGLRLDPRVIHTQESQTRDIPYGVFFCHGRRFNAFHCRFRDISRGGMRIVTPANSELHALESSRQYEECWGLAFAQHLKNKDIPEGGSKAVVLIQCEDLTSEAKQFIMRKSVKAFTNTLLDLILENEETKSHIVDRLGKKEVLYLGPDEQVTVDDIDWIVKRAKLRGYDNPNALMSSKPRAGINHKEYAVTSEGVNCFLDEALQRVLSINPKKDRFSLKLTGGPGGDVAGNMIKLSIRDYGRNVSFVGIADESGCAEDPDGLDHEELMRLVDMGLTISHFDPTKLGPDGSIHLVDNEAGIKHRNSMHNRLKADAFVPCGGRPNTIDISNYKAFLSADGEPSSKLIVEGANLFITKEARKALYDEAGVTIIKDSSANKCGVITSSYEICAAMMLSEEEFYEQKDTIITEVLEKLRSLARLEAELLFREFESEPDSMPAISQRISNSINVTTDALIESMISISKEDRDKLLPLFHQHLPPTLSKIAFDEIDSKVPAQYIINAIASCLSSKIVYHEGCNFIDSIPKHKLAEVSLKYIEKEKEIAHLKQILLEANVPVKEKDSILSILEKGGVKTALHMK